MPDSSNSISKRKQDSHNSFEKKLKLDIQVGLSLHQASSKGDKAPILQHIENGSDLNTKDNSGWTPLHLAIQYNQMEIAILLVNHGADLKAENNERKTPLHLAVQVESKELTKTLLQKGAEINAKDERGFTPLHVATDFGNLELVVLLVENGANLEEISNLGHTVLHLAAKKGFFDIAKILVEKGSNVNAKNFKGFVPLQLAINYAAFSKTMILAKILIENNADINNLCDSSWSSLHLAIKRSLIDVVCLLLENSDKIDKTALTVAVQFGKPEVCKLILSKDNLTNFKPNPKSPSLLHLAVEKQCLKTIQILIDLGAEVNCKDDKGVTPTTVKLYHY